MLILFKSLVADIIFNGVDARVQTDCILLDYHFFLDERVHLLFKKVAFVDIIGLKLEVVIVQVLDVFYDFLKDVIRGFGGVVLKGRTLASQQLHLLLVVIELLDGFLCASLLNYGNMEIIKDI